MAKLSFGDYELDVAGYQLRRGVRFLKLERIPMDLLILLVERRGQLVTRGEIVERLWGKDVFLDIENSINTAVGKLRRALKDKPEHPAFIQTVTGKGYRFIAPVQLAAPTLSQPFPAAEGARAMLAVLPFENLSSDPEQEYFADGITEETISYLGRMNPALLGVIARTSSLAYKRTTKSISQIGRELRVDYVLESSVRREGRRVRITSQLIRVDDQTHLWAETYDRDGTSVLEVQNELGRAIARQVQIKLAPQYSMITGAQTQDLDAYDLYLRGRYQWNQLTPVAIRRAIGYFEQAVARDPQYALAYAGLADCYGVLPITCDEPAIEILPKALAAANRALDLNDSLAEAHSCLGCIKLWMEWDWKGAESALRRAIELNSNYVTAHRWHAHLLSDLGRHTEATQEMTVARQVDPLSPVINGLSGHLLYQAREYGLALPHLKNALALNPNLWVLHTWLARVYERSGMLEEAMNESQTAFDLSGGNTDPFALKAYIQARRGDHAAAERAIEVMSGLAATKYVPPYNIAIVHCGLEDVESALSCLERAYETRDVRMTFLAVEPRWDFMRHHPRFLDLLRRLDLPELSMSRDGVIG